MDNIRVSVRVRPFIQREKDQKSEAKWSVNTNCLKQKDGGQQTFTYDRVFGNQASTDDVYCEIANPIIEDAMQGFNGTIFAYGQTASGKTFTMMGSDNEPGIIPQAMTNIYETIEHSPDREFLLRVSYMEIYNENVFDLFGDRRKSLDIREKPDGSIFVSNLKEEMAANLKAIMACMKKGEANRHFGVTNMNERSSRSHTIFRVIIESRIRNDESDGAVNVAHLNLVDLAGSEKVKQTGAVGQRLTEGGHINKSLLTLGQVICQLSENASFISYRDSKLTRILQNSLGGNSKTAIICNITVASFEETLSTLRFASSAKKIRNKPILNEVLTDEALLKRYKKELDTLKKRLEGQSGEQELKEKLAEKENLEIELKEKLQRLTDMITVSSQNKPAHEDFKQRKRRRETWCPGKGRHPLSLGMSRTTAGLDLPDIAMKKSRLSSLSNLDESEETDLSFVVHQHAELLESPPDRISSEEEMESSPIALLHQVEQKSKTIRDLEARLQEKDNEIEMLNNAFECGLNNEQENSELKTKCDKLEKERDDATMVQTELLTKVSTLERQMRDDSKDENIDDMMKLSEDLLQTIDTMKIEQKDHEQEKEKLEIELANVQLAYHALEEDLKRKDMELNELQEFTKIECDLKDQSLMEKREKLFELEGKCQDSDQADIRVIELEVQVENLLKERDVLEERITALESQEMSQMEHFDIKATDFQDKIAKLEEEKAAAEAKVTDLANQVMSQSAVSLDSCDLKTIELGEQVKALLEEKDRRLAELEETIPHMADQNRQIQELEHRLDALAREKEDLEIKLTDMDGEKQCDGENMRVVELEGKIMTLQEENDTLREQVESGDDDLEADLKSQIAQIEAEREEAASQANQEREEFETKIGALEKAKKDGETRVDALNSCIEELELELASLHESNQNLLLEMDSKPTIDGSDAKDLLTIQNALTDEKQKHQALQDRFEKLVADQSLTKGKLFAEENKDMDLQHRLDQLEKARKEALDNFSRTNAENMKDIERLNKQVYELNCKLQKAVGDCELASHKSQKLDKDNAELKQEIRTLDDLRMQHENTNRNQRMDPDKMLDRIKKMGCALDLTNQRCQKYESKVKELEGEALKAEKAIFEKHSLQVQLRESQFSLEQKHTEITQLHQRYSSSYTELAQMKLQIDTLQDQVHKLQTEKDRALKQLEELSDEKNSLSSEKSTNKEDVNRLANENSGLHKQVKELKQKVDDLVSEVEHYKNLPPPVDVDEMERTHKSTLEKQMADVRKEERVRYEEKTMELLEEEKAKFEQELTNEIMQIKTQAEDKFDEARKMMSSEQNDLVNSIKVSHKEEMSKIALENDQTLKAIEEQHKGYIQELKQEHGVEITKMMSASQGDLANTVTSLKEELSKLQEELSDAETILTNKEAELADMEAEHAETIKLLKGEVNDIKEKHAAEIETILKEHTTQMETLIEKYQLENAQSEEEVDSKYTAEIESLKVTIQSLTDAKCELDEQICIFNEKLESIQKERDELICENEELRLTKEDVSPTLDDTFSRVNMADLQNQLEEKDAKVQELEQQLGAINTKIEMGKQLLMKKDAEIDDLIEQYKFERTAHEKFMEENETLREQLEAHDADGDKTAELTVIENQLRGKIAELESCVGDYKAQLDESKAQIKSNETLDAQISTFETILAEKEMAVNDLLIKMESAEVKHSEDLLTLELEYTEKLGKASEGAKIKELEVKLETCESEKKELRDVIQQLEAEVEELRTCFKDYDDALSEKSTAIEKAEQDLIEIRDDIDRVKAESEMASSNLKQELSDAKTELASATQKHEQAQKEFTEQEAWLKKCCDDADAELEGKNTELDNYKTELQRLTEELAKANVMANTAVSGCSEEQLLSQINELKSEIIQIKSSGAELEKVKIAIEEELEKKDSELKEMEKNHEEYVAYLMKHCDDADAELEQSKEDLAGSETLLKIKAKEISTLKENLKKVSERRPSEDRQQLIDENESLKKQQFEMKCKISTLERNVILGKQPLEDKIHQLESSIKKYEMQVLELRKELRRAKNSVNESILSKPSSVSASPKKNAGELAVEQFYQKAEAKYMKDQLTELETKLDRELQNTTKLKKYVMDMESKLDTYKSHFKKELGEEDRRALKEVMTNSPRRPNLDETVRMGATFSRAAAAKAGSDEGPADCNTQ